MTRTSPSSNPRPWQRGWTVPALVCGLTALLLALQLSGSDASGRTRSDREEPESRGAADGPRIRREASAAPSLSAPRPAATPAPAATPGAEPIPVVEVVKEEPGPVTGTSPTAYPRLKQGHGERAAPRRSKSAGPVPRERTRRKRDG